MDATALFEEAGRHFARYPRPADYIDRAHCCECQEHYDELAEVTAASIAYEHVANAGWDPTCFLTAEGFRYYFPGLARVADSHPEDFLEALLLRLGGFQGEAFSADDRSFVTRLLEHWWLREDIDDRVREAVGRALDSYARPSTG